MAASSTLESVPVLDEVDSYAFDVHGFVVLRGLVRGPELHRLRRAAAAASAGPDFGALADNAEVLRHVAELVGGGTSWDAGRGAPSFLDPELDLDSQRRLEANSHLGALRDDPLRLLRDHADHGGAPPGRPNLSHHAQRAYTGPGEVPG